MSILIRALVASLALAPVSALAQSSPSGTIGSGEWRNGAKLTFSEWDAVFSAKADASILTNPTTISGAWTFTNGLYLSGSGGVSGSLKSVGSVDDVAVYNKNGAAVLAIPTGSKVTQLAGQTVASLPTCSATYINSIAAVTDALSPAAGATVVGGGTINAEVFCDGVTWKATSVSPSGVTVAQGGTGSSNAAGARANLGTGGLSDANVWTAANIGTALWTFTNNLYLPITVSPSSTAAAANRGIYAFETMTGSCAGSCYYNMFAVNTDNIPVGIGNPAGGRYSGATDWAFYANWGGPSMTGDRAVTSAAFLLNRTTNNTVQNASYSAQTLNATATVNDNGTGPTAATASTWLGIVNGQNVISTLGPAATYFEGLQGTEYDIQAQAGSSVFNKEGVIVVQFPADQVQGSAFDAGYSLASARATESITGGSSTLSTATFNVASNSFLAGATITVTGESSGTLNQTFIIVSQTPTSVTVSCASCATPSSGGTIIEDSVGWKYGVAFGGMQGQRKGNGWPFNPDSTAIGCISGCGTLDTVLDFSGATIGSYFLHGPGFAVDGSGSVNANSLGLATPLAVASGGTGATTPAGARAALGITDQNQAIIATSYGLLDGAAGDTTRTANIAAGTNIAALSAVGDYRVGDDIRIRKAGATYSAGSPTGLSAVQNGATGATSCTYWVSNDDGAGGLSPAVSVTVANANATRTTANSVRLTYTPPVSHHPGIVWRNCGSGESFVGVAQPQIVATMTPGSGYTNGTYQWTATGGSCTVEPRGFIVVGGPLETSGAIATDIGRVDIAYPGIGCTSAPTVALPSGMGSGTGGAITLSMVATFDDAGQPVVEQPEYVSNAHSTLAQNDWLIGTIGAINGSAATLCVPGTYPASCTALNAINGVSIANTRHSWTRVIQNAINAVNPLNNKTGVTDVKLPCGIFETEAGNISITTSYTVLKGKGDCTTIVPSGVGPTVRVGYTGSHIPGDGVVDILLIGSNKTAGYAVDAYMADSFKYTGVHTYHNPGILRFLGANSLYMFDNPQNNDGWAWGYADFDIESTPTQLTWNILMSNNYANSGNLTSFTSHYGINTHDGFRFNDVQTIYASNQNAISNAPGRGWAFLASSGNAYAANGGGAIGNAFLHCLGCDSEFSVGDEFFVDGCAWCEAVGFLNGSITGYELHLTSNLNKVRYGSAAAFVQGVQWRGGKMNGAYLGAAKIEGGIYNQISNTQMAIDCYSSPGACPSIEVAGTAKGAIITNDFFSYPGTSGDGNPVQLDAGASGVVVKDNVFNKVGAVVVDNSGVSSNVIGPNSGDTLEGAHWDNVNQLFGIGSGASYLNNNNRPGMMVEQIAPSNSVLFTVSNDGTGSNTSTRIQQTLRAVPNAWTAQFLNYNSGAPSVTTQIGSGVTGGMLIDASNGGATAPLTLKGGSTAGVSVTGGPFSVGGFTVDGGGNETAASVTATGSVSAASVTTAGGASLTDVLTLFRHHGTPGSGGAALAVCNSSTAGQLAVVSDGAPTSGVCGVAYSPGAGTSTQLVFCDGTSGWQYH